MTVWRRIPALVAVLLAVAGLSACASIPRNGPVVSGQSVSNDLQDGVLQAILEGPSPGQDPEQVVRGFIQAAVGFGDDHTVARSFLAPSKRLVWSPDASVEVYPSDKDWKVSAQQRAADGTVVPLAAVKPSSKKGAASPSPTPSSTTAQLATTASVTVTTPVSATVDQDGRYSLAVPGARTTRTFGLIRSEGEWRISSLDDGILVNSSDFSVTFRPFPVYFADPTGRYLVPDVHWFPANSNITGVREVPTALVRALLDGPAGYLRGAVVSGAPAGTQMAVSAVVVNDQVATVDLTDPVRRASIEQKQLLQAQLLATLSAASINSVQITVRRTPLEIPAVADPGAAAGAANGPAAADGNSADSGSPQVDPQVDDEPVVISKGAIARLVTREDSLPVAGLAGLAVPGANHPAVSALGDAYADLDGDRSRLLLQMPGAKVSTLVQGTALTGPSFDPWGWVWTSSRDNPGWVFAARQDPGTVKVKAPWLTGMTVLTLRISREGARALVAVESHGQAHVFVAGVTRDENGQPIALTQPVGLIPDLETVDDVSWVDEDQVVVLGTRTGRDGEQPWVAQIGGQIKETAPIKGAESVSAGNGELGIMVGTAQGTYTLLSGTWSQISSARWATFAG